MKISSKAKTLEDLSKVIKNAKVLPLVRFYAKEYEKNKNKIFDEVLKLKAKSFIVRSSSINGR